MGTKIFRHRADIEAEVFKGSAGLLLTGLDLVKVIRNSEGVSIEELETIGGDTALAIEKSELHALISILLDCQAELKGVSTKKEPVRPKY